jgi:hypothetical protein
MVWGTLRQRLAQTPDCMNLARNDGKAQRHMHCTFCSRRCSPGVARRSMAATSPARLRPVACSAASRPRSSYGSASSHSDAAVLHSSRQTLLSVIC